MKLCLRCVECLNDILTDKTVTVSFVGAPEADCEFWAHKKLNTLKFSLQVSAQRYVAKQTADCKHYDREEIDLYLVLTRENIKLTQCRGCKVWLERINPGQDVVAVRSAIEAEIASRIRGGATYDNSDLEWVLSLFVKKV